jgi:hypothetical protein
VAAGRAAGVAVSNQRSAVSEINMQGLKIIGVCIVAAVCYGIVHDQFTARICLEYFTIFHPPILPDTASPTILALAWGVLATWWVGTILGVFLAIAARAGSRPTLSVTDVLPMIRALLLIMAGCAVLFGLGGYFWGELPANIAAYLPPGAQHRFAADWWAHSASYASGFIGGIVLCALAYRKRRAAAKAVS